MYVERFTLYWFHQESVPKVLHHQLLSREITADDAIYSVEDDGIITADDAIYSVEDDGITIYSVEDDGITLVS